ncbi:hypothetical protein [Actinomadura rupiterrae]|uniref:hypothetical protein n=1 Tax=Actinomadura rupiterrae TaxID=559627 RepID=UPI0020A2E797|nr:hypothetical protein [Actinomadura rupiterrae]MCP2339140.1 hypothetical protein [Actinomadura rupiterrae]
MAEDELPPRFRPENMSRDRRLALQLAAYRRLMDEIVPESQYWLLNRRENPENIRVYGSIVERAAARTRAEQQMAKAQSAEAARRAKGTA